MATLDEQIEALTRRLDERDRAPLAAEVAEAKGLPAGLAKRLLGKTREELEADADELLSIIEEAGSEEADGAKDEEDDEFDPGKVADQIRRGF